MMIYICIENDCNKIVSGPSRRCKSCAQKGSRNVMFGKTHSIEVKERLRQFHLNKPLSLATRKKMSNIRRGKKRSTFSEQHKKNISLNHRNVNGKNNPNFGKGCQSKVNSYKGNYYKNIWMRSSWEISYAKYLDKHKIKWKYEPRAFDLGNSTYRPDFYLPRVNEWIEIKGYWRKGAKEKFNLFKKLYPEINIKVLNEKKLIADKIL